jgi:hypothetical protein
VQNHNLKTEQNEFNASLVTLAKKNNWTPYYHDNSGWHEYEEPISIVTDIDAATAQEETTEGNTLRYNLQGQRVSKGYCGVVILKGRKVRAK